MSLPLEYFVREIDTMKHNIREGISDPKYTRKVRKELDDCYVMIHRIRSGGCKAKRDVAIKMGKAWYEAQTVSD